MSVHNNMVLRRLDLVVTLYFHSQMVLQNVEKAQIKVRMKKDNVVGMHCLYNILHVHI